MFGIPDSGIAWCAPGKHAGGVPAATSEPPLLPLAFTRSTRHVARGEDNAVRAEHALLRSLCHVNTRLCRDQIIPENHLLFDVLRETPRPTPFAEPARNRPT